MPSKCHYCKKTAEPDVLMNIGGNIVSVCFACDELMVASEVDYITAQN